MRLTTLTRLVVRLIGFYGIFVGMTTVLIPVLSLLLGFFLPGVGPRDQMTFGASFFASLAPMVAGIVVIARADWIAQKLSGTWDTEAGSLGIEARDLERLLLALLGVYLVATEIPELLRTLLGQFVWLARHDEPVDLAGFGIPLLAIAGKIAAGLVLATRSRQLVAWLDRLRK